MKDDVKKAAIDWLKAQHADRKTALEAPASSGESPREKTVRSFAEAELRRDIAVIDFIYNEIAGLPS